MHPTSFTYGTTLHIPLVASCILLSALVPETNRYISRPDYRGESYICIIVSQTNTTDDRDDVCEEKR